MLGDIQILLFHLEEDLPPDHLHRATCSKGRTHCKQALLYHFSSIRWLWLCYNLNIECPVFVGYSEKEYLISNWTFKPYRYSWFFLSLYILFFYLLHETFYRQFVSNYSNSGKNNWHNRNNFFIQICQQVWAVYV